MTASREPALFLLQPAHSLRLINIALHLFVLAAMWWCLYSLNPLPQSLSTRWWPLLVALILLGSGMMLDRQLALRGTRAIRCLRHDSEGWSVGGDEASLQPVELRFDTTVNAAFVVLCWRDQRRRRGQLLIVPAMLEASAYRCLCRLLWQAGAAEPSQTPSV